MRLLLLVGVLMLSGCATVIQGDSRHPIYVNAHVVVDINQVKQKE